ncbi:MAG: exodeoxyribonuclease V subunit alpha [Gammaproteobacteria bacterium]
MNLFDALCRSGALRPRHEALARSLQRLDREDGIDSDPLLLAGAALASLAVARGHAALDPAQPLLLFDADPGLVWPGAGAWRDALAASRWVDCSGRTVGEAGSSRPLALEHGLLYLRRYRDHERRLAADLLRLAAGDDADPVDAGAPAALFAALFPQAGDDLQAQAARLALRRRLVLVTGGPGTGKTTTIARILVLLLAQAHAAGAPPRRIALAAPTGRAAERMAESLRRGAAAMRAMPQIDPGLLDALPDAALTLHRLLGTRPDSPGFRHDRAHPLPYDVVVVDEASMVDLPLMARLLQAIPDGARLLLLGDPDQLPSVEAGDVLAAVAAAGEDAEAGAAAPLAGRRVHLRRGHRQSGRLQLAPLADAVRAGDADAALALLRGGTLDGVHFHERMDDPLDTPARDALLDHWRALRDRSDPGEALQQAARLRLLTALRAGPRGAATLNARIETALAGARREPWFQGRLLLVTENDYRQRLFNGDIGICLRDGRGAPVAWFAAGDGVRGFHPASLPAHEGAFATTVHKAQGSEFDRVWLLLPRHDARPLTRELVYTAITRARSALHVCADPELLRAALARRVRRVSALRARLQAV